MIKNTLTDTFKNIDKRYYVIIAAWFVFNLLQSAFTYLHFDEAYYYIYSTDLAWGYFDHPPMVALLSYMGYSLFGNEIGLRFFHVLLSTGSLFLIIDLLKNKASFRENTIVIFSFPLVFLHVAGFLAVPDTAMVFFSLVFLRLYRSFLEKETVLKSVCIGLTAAALVLSKYHGGLFLFFIFLSNRKLLLKRNVWIAIFVFTICIFPHLLWQYHNDFPSFSYHLVQRVKGFKLSYVFDYLGAQVVVAGLLAGVIVIYSVIIFKPKDVFDKTIKYIVVGFWLFFLLMSFRDHIELHWTAIAVPSMMYIAVSVLKERKGLKKWFTRLAIPGIVLVIIVRVLMIGALPAFGPKKVMWGWDRERDSINANAGDLPVLVSGSYKLASLYSFYSGKQVPLLPEYDIRYSQFDLQHSDDDYIGKKVFVITPRDKESDEYMIFPEGNKVRYFIEDNFVTYRNLKFEDVSTIQKDYILIKGSIKNMSSHILDYKASERLKPYLVVSDIGHEHTEIYRIGFDELFDKASIAPGEVQDFLFSFDVPAYTKLNLQVRFYEFRGDEVILDIN